VNLFHGRKFMTRRHATVIILVSTLLTIRDATPSLADDTDKLIGTWKLVSAVSEELATGQKTNLYEGAPIGFITYGADGRVMTVIADSPRKKPSGAVATAVEAEALFRSMAAYAGTLGGASSICHGLEPTSLVGDDGPFRRTLYRYALPAVLPFSA
jgi:Lipocalin-like domain